MPHFEREFWQTHIELHSPPQIEAAEFMKFFARVQTIVPDVRWQFPTMAGEGVRMAVGPNGLEPLPPVFLTGDSADGWMFVVSARELVARHQQFVDGDRRGIDPNELPSPEAFTEAAVAFLTAAPEALLSSGWRASTAVNYVLATGDVFPPSLAAELVGCGRRSRGAPVDGATYVQHHQDTVFETSGDNRVVWNTTVRIGNWFADDGSLRPSSAIVRTMDLRTVVPEPSYPPPRIQERPPALPIALLKSAAATGGPLALQRVLDRFRRTLPEGVELHV